MTLMNMQDKRDTRSRRYEFKAFKLEGLWIENNIRNVKKRKVFHKQNSNFNNLICCYHVF